MGRGLLLAFLDRSLVDQGIGDSMLHRTLLLRSSGLDLRLLKNRHNQSISS